MALRNLSSTGVIMVKPCLQEAILSEAEPILPYGARCSIYRNVLSEDHFDRYIRDTGTKTALDYTMLDMKGLV